MSGVFGAVLQLFGRIAIISCAEAGVMELAIFGVTLWFATFALVRIRHSSAIRCMQKTQKTGVTTASRSKKSQTISNRENHGLSILEATAVDFGSFW